MKKNCCRKKGRRLNLDMRIKLIKDISSISELTMKKGDTI